MADPFEYRLEGRRPATLIGLGIALLLLGLAIVAKAPWYIFLCWGVIAAWLGWTTWRNPVSGLRIDDRAITWHQGAKTESRPISDISDVRFTTWTDGPDTFRFHMADGTEWDVPSLCLPPCPVLREALAARGVAVRAG